MRIALRFSVGAAILLLRKSCRSLDGDLLRWKIRRFLQTLAGENAVKLDLKTTPDMAMTHVHVHDELAVLYPRPRKTKR